MKQSLHTNHTHHIFDKPYFTFQSCNNNKNPMTDLKKKGWFFKTKFSKVFFPWQFWKGSEETKKPVSFSWWVSGVRGRVKGTNGEQLAGHAIWVPRKRMILKSNFILKNDFKEKNRFQRKNWFQRENWFQRRKSCCHVVRSAMCCALHISCFIVCVFVCVWGSCLDLHQVALIS